MSKSDYRHRRDSIEPHMSAVVTAMAPQYLTEVATALSIIGYAAHLGGPPLIGFAAEHTSLTFTVAAAVVIVAVALVSVRKARETKTA